MLNKLLTILKIKTSFQARDWTRNTKLLQSGACSGFNFTR